MSKEYPTPGEEFTISLATLWWKKDGNRILSGIETMDIEYGYIEASYYSDPDLSNGDGCFDLYDENGNLCIMDAEVAVVVEIHDNGDVELRGPCNHSGIEPIFFLTGEEFSICAF